MSVIGRRNVPLYGHSVNANNLQYDVIWALRWTLEPDRKTV